MILYWHITRAHIASRRLLTRCERWSLALDLSRTPTPTVTVPKGRK